MRLGGQDQVAGQEFAFVADSSPTCRFHQTYLLCGSDSFNRSIGARGCKMTA
jgi:hypothetical protein